jgi:tetratricopeptide (TPR) repeat protein
LLGEEDSSTLDTMRNRAVLYRAERDYARAEALLTKILEVRRRVFGEAHRDTTAILAALGEVRIQLRKYAEAEPLLRAAGSGYEKARSDNWRRYSSQSALGASLVGQRKYLEAEPLLLTGYQGILERETTIPAENRSDLEQARKWIVRLYQDWGKPDKLVEWRETFHSGQVAGTVQKQ